MSSAETASLRIWEQAGAARFSVRAQPGAKREKIAGIWNEMLKISVQAPADEGRANEALLRFLAQSLGVKRAGLALVSGDKSREKTIAVEGESAESLRRRIREALES